jgi:epoxyqueuosine reductase QueG
MSIDVQWITDFIQKKIDEPGRNYVSQREALSPEVISLKMYEAGKVCVASPGDPFFVKFKEPGVIGPHFILPEEWLQGVRSVISIFFVMTPRVKESNSRTWDWPSYEWIHAREVGHDFIDDAMESLKEELNKNGYESIVPKSDSRFAFNRSDLDPSSCGADYTSVWSERHVAFVAGHGTFGLSRGLLTKYGAAGRFGSLVTRLDLPKTERSYTDPFEHCIKCGVCAEHCPGKAISIESGQSHKKCREFIDSVADKFHLKRHPCGKCQVSAPCQDRWPKTA